MAIEEKKTTNLPIDAKKASINQITPHYGSWIENDKLYLEIALPGVKKENIQMKALDDYITVRAMRENISYSLDLDLNVKIEPKKINARYNEGLLLVDIARYKAEEHMIGIPINGLKREVNLEKEKKKKETKFIGLYPDTYREIDYYNKSIDIEVSLPGVKDEDIELKVNKDFMVVDALTDTIEYRTNKSFGTEINPDKTIASYSNGLLKIHTAIHDRMDDAKEIKL